MQVAIVAAISADGYIGRSSEELADWTTKEDKKFFVEKTKEAGVMVMGRTTFETIGRPLPGRKIIVMTHDASAFSPIPGQVEFVSASAKEIVEQEEKRGTKLLVIAGGSKIYSLFLREKLITDLFLTVEPVLFGGGIPLAEAILETRLSRVEVRMLGEQSILLHYIVL